MTQRDYEGLSREELIRLLLDRDTDEAGGLRLHYKGQTAPWRIVRRVQPRRQKIETKLSCGTEEEQSRNAIVEGENLQGMVSLYKYRGQVDLILTDPPYNTGSDFRYNDKWDEDPNDPDLGALVPSEDGSRHSKWLRFMVPRLWAMRDMLRPGGVLAICIDQRELYRLGLVLDEMFGEGNRLAIINWQKTTSKNNTRRVSQVTEYILVYAKSSEIVKTGLLERSLKADARFSNVDGDPLGDWRVGADLSAPGASTHPTMIYQIQSPFTGILHPPPEGRCWGMEKSRIKEYLEDWGVDYIERDVGDGRKKALILKGATITKGKCASNAIRMKRRVPSVSTFVSNTACAVVPDPAKGSSTMPFCGHQIWMILRNSLSGFTVSKPWPRPIISLSSSTPSRFRPLSVANHDAGPSVTGSSSSSTQNDEGTEPAITSCL